MNKVIYLNNLDEFLFNLRNPYPDNIYAFIPKDYAILSKEKEKLIIDTFQNDKNCVVYSDIKINGIPQYYPSYNIDHNIPIVSPIYVNLAQPIHIEVKTLPEVMNILTKHVFGIHIPELIFEWHLQGT